MTTVPRPVTVHVYHHTHWDREWWSTRERFRFRLVHTVDAILDALAAGPDLASFVLDGQTLVLKDYLQVRPGRRDELIRQIRDGRLFVGPWHILPDEFLVSGEATLRNLWLGERTARDLGVEVSRVGYLPDQFGHIAQMPQLLRGFGIDSAVVWRGSAALRWASRPAQPRSGSTGTCTRGPVTTGFPTHTQRILVGGARRNPRAGGVPAPGVLPEPLQGLS
ncbi:hypothetical protein ACFSC4_21810 [Deinococcus malanensis]|uniref:glycoside hydrolase family 38 N-terminal domain-containing protein n=1 Tax=Deinococcus malanensis TaxID=1706855 RepID=UPI0036291AA9